MHDLKSHLIESAVRPFHDNVEMEIAASKLLGNMVQPNGEDAE